MNFLSKFLVLGLGCVLSTCSSHSPTSSRPTPRAGQWDQGGKNLDKTATTIIRETEPTLLKLTQQIPGFGGIVFTQYPSPLEGREVGRDRSRIMLLTADGSSHSLSSAFLQASDPEISFDGERVLFAGKKKATDFWQIFEIQIDGTNLKQITNENFDCRNPVYQSTMYVITSTEPWKQITFLGHKPGQAPSLYSCRLDGSSLRQLTFNPYGVSDPFVMQDGRILYSSWQQPQEDATTPSRQVLFTVNSDGTDPALFSGDEGANLKHSAMETSKNLVVFVESEIPSSGLGGHLAAVSLRRNLHSHRKLSKTRDGVFQTPSPLPNGEILVSHKYGSGFQSFGLYRFDPSSGKLSLLFDDPTFHELQPKLLTSRSMPDGRSSIVNEAVQTGELYCMSVHTTDVPAKTFDSRQVDRIRVVEGRKEKGKVQRYALGEVPVEKDGSFNVRIPANLPLQLEALNHEGKVLRSCQWIWVKNKEPRGCIGCHEDGERTPENRMPDALRKPSVDLLPPPSERMPLTDQGRRDLLQSIQKGGK